MKRKEKKAHNKAQSWTLGGKANNRNRKNRQGLKKNKRQRVVTEAMEHVFFCRLNVFLSTTIHAVQVGLVLS